MPDGGTLSIDTTNVTVDAAMVAAQPGLTPGRYVRLRVSDTGTGMSPTVVERAFEPFFTTKPKGCGTGLGLATVYALVTQSGGHPRIYSEPGLGTTFTAFLPAGDPVAVPPVEPLLPAPHQRVETVLIVEDGDTLREVTGRTLARRGHNVLTAASGRAAIELAEHYPGTIDLLLTDVSLPEMLGREVAERVRALRPGIRVVYMSGYAESVLAAQGTIDDGATLVEKPFSEAELITKLRDTLDAAS
jgi:CheY-like chemotaxis protein